MQKEIRQALTVCPPELQRAVEALPEATQRRMEELRLRIGGDGRGAGSTPCRDSQA